MAVAHILIGLGLPPLLLFDGLIFNPVFASVETGLEREGLAGVAWPGGGRSLFCPSQVSAATSTKRNIFSRECAFGPMKVRRQLTTRSLPKAKFLTRVIQRREGRLPSEEARQTGRRSVGRP